MKARVVALVALAAAVTLTSVASTQRTTPSSPRAPASPTCRTSWSPPSGLVLLLEATRRAVGLPMTVLAILFLVYIIFGRYMPDVLAHKGASWERMLSHQWLTTEGVFGVALGVSSSLHLHLRAVRRARSTARARATT